MDDLDLTRRLLAGTNPVPAQALDGVADRSQAVALRRRLLATRRDPTLPLGPVLRGGPLRTNRSRRSAGVALAVVALAVAVVLVVSPWSAPDTASAETPPILGYGLVGATPFGKAEGKPAEATLLQLARVAAARPAAPQPGDVAYVRTDNWFFTAVMDGKKRATGIRPVSSETWTAPDGSGVRHDRTSPPLRVEGWLPPGGPTGTVVSTTLPAGTQVQPTASQLAAAVGPSGVRTALLDGIGCVPGSSDADCLLQDIPQVHNQQVVPGAVDSEMWQMLAAEKGVVTLGAVTDRAGRPAIAITTSLELVAPVRCVLLIDPSDGALLGFEQVAMDPKAGYVLDVPAVVGFTAYLASGWATSLPS
ncbi:MAG TPA: CU044_5270 family protein [Cellulomonadaceae bacterium]|nr:CU044_5270 family protein [Cellulomonadaceae bacterium]